MTFQKEIHIRNTHIYTHKTLSRSPVDKSIQRASSSTNGLEGAGLEPEDRRVCNTVVTAGSEVRQSPQSPACPQDRVTTEHFCLAAESSREA